MRLPTGWTQEPPHHGGGSDRGGKNVFEDIGYWDAAERQAKLRLAYALNQVLEKRDLTQTAAAQVLGLRQSKVSALRPKERSSD